MKIIFMGTPDFAVESLKACIDNHDVVAVFTQPDRPKGRGKKLTPPPVKVTALEHDIIVYQPEKIKTKEFEDIIVDLNPDCIVVVAYGQILSKIILDTPKYGCINVHGSLLPKYRGASPIQWSIVMGEDVTGITTMYMGEGLDTGDMLIKAKTNIDNTTTAGELHDTLMLMGAEILVETLIKLEDGTVKAEVQDDSLSSYAPLLKKEMGKIDWDMNGDQIIRKVNGLNPWPVAYGTYDGKPLKLFVVEKTDQSFDASNGEIIAVDKTGMYVRCSDSVLLVKEAQFSGSKRMHISQYILGHEIELGKKL
ncbi:MAG: methionyl-tRNA formyltransferase [Acidaminobacteraceae bacterium]